MNIVLNGEPHQFKNGSTVSDLLEALNLHPGGVAVEHNRRIIKKADYEKTVLQENDTVEIVHFVGGG